MIERGEEIFEISVKWNLFGYITRKKKQILSTSCSLCPSSLLSFHTPSSRSLLFLFSSCNLFPLHPATCFSLLPLFLSTSDLSLLILSFTGFALLYFILLPFLLLLNTSSPPLIYFSAPSHPPPSPPLILSFPASLSYNSAKGVLD